MPAFALGLVLRVYRLTAHCIQHEEGGSGCKESVHGAQKNEWRPGGRETLLGSSDGLLVLPWRPRTDAVSLQRRCKCLTLWGSHGGTLLFECLLGARGTCSAAMHMAHDAHWS